MNDIDFVVARRALAALRMSIARGSSPGWNAGAAAFGTGLAAVFGACCVCCALPLGAVEHAQHDSGDGPLPAFIAVHRGLGG